MNLVLPCFLTLRMPYGIAPWLDLSNYAGMEIEPCGRDTSLIYHLSSILGQREHVSV
jgi:hypothetical protein